MADTYTYTARSAENPERVVTFTLRNSRLSVGVGAPLEQVERAIEIGRGEERPEEPFEEGVPAEIEEGRRPKLWLRPIAVSLVEQGTRPMHVDDVVASVMGESLHVRAWVRAGGLRLVPITLIDGRVDNPVAARDFVDEVQARKAVTGFKPFGLLDYWATWILAVFAGFFVFQQWRRNASDRE
jgi:hypothetical protein